MKKCCDTVQQK